MLFDIVVGALCVCEYWSKIKTFQISSVFSSIFTSLLYQWKLVFTKFIYFRHRFFCDAHAANNFVSSFIHRECVRFLFFHLLVDKRRQLLNFWIAVFFESNIINKFMYQLILFNSLFLFLSFERFKLDFLQSVYWLVYLMVFLKFVASFYLMPACKYWFVWWSLNSSLFSLSVFPIC